MTADLPTVPAEVRFRAEELWAEALMVRNVGVDGLPAVVDYVWAEALAALTTCTFHRNVAEDGQQWVPCVARHDIALFGEHEWLPVAADSEATP